jgi:hypothetical protein
VASRKPLYTDDFRRGLDRWLVEAEKPARVEVAGGMLELDTPEGLSVWFRPELAGPVMIEYQAQAVSAGGPNDRVSDLNAFWMATDPRSPGDLIAKPRSGAFADYDQLQTYYVGQGGNANTTTRFRRYVGRTATGRCCRRTTARARRICWPLMLGRPYGWSRSAV